MAKLRHPGSANPEAKLAATGPKRDTPPAMSAESSTRVDGFTGLPATPELLGIARRVCWWQSPEEGLADRVSFLARVMALGTWTEVELVRSLVGEVPLRRVLEQAPSGLFDLRSWYYWHHYFGVTAVPPLPTRQLS